MYKSLSLRTKDKVSLLDITSRVGEVIQESGIESGILTLYVPHTTAAVTINESADPSVREDIVKELKKLVPFEDNYQHLEGNSAAHIKSSLVGCSETVIIKGGRPDLGRWQGVFFCEFDGPRTRKIILKAFEA